MLNRKFLFSFAALTLMLARASTVLGQSFEDGLSLGPSARPFGATESALVDTDYYEYDARLWAPYDVTSLDGERRWQSGFYAELGFAYFSLTRPEAVGGEDPRGFNTGSDYSWGRDLELGFMSTQDAGWAIGWLDMEGSVYVNGSFPINGVGITIPDPMLLRTTYDKVELNRQFRQALSNGGYIEPYVGVRYVGLNDNSIEDTNPTATTDLRFRQQVSNSAFGPQVGARYFRYHGRFRVGTEAAMGALYNNQRYFSGSYLLNNPTATFTVLEFTNSDDDVLPVLDLGLRVDYWITRDVSLRAGAGLQYMWHGVARADIRTASLNPQSITGPGAIPSVVNSEDFVAAGVTFGIDWKR
jgi:hypothetical protein